VGENSHRKCNATFEACTLPALQCNGRTTGLQVQNCKIGLKDQQDYPITMTNAARTTAVFAHNLIRGGATGDQGMKISWPSGKPQPGKATRS